jgi:hypothetical protein
MTAVAASATVAVRSVAANRSPWLPLLAVWVGLSVVAHFGSGQPALANSALIAVTLALPIAVAWLVARTALLRGSAPRTAAVVAFGLGSLVAALTPLIQLFLLCRVLRDCIWGGG